jgi:8-amino-7-oxononanoate synthase
VGDRWLRRLDHRAGLRARAGLSRQLAPRGASSGLIDLAGNDYLGLANHPDVVAAASKALAEYGLGATGSRLVRGSTDEHAALEAALASLLRQPGALVYSSGYLANLGAIAGAVSPLGVIVIDSHAHASLHDGCRLSGMETKVFTHADVDALRATLADLADRPILVVTESVFSVDGDLAPLTDIHAACREAGAVLLVDDAHALGVLGPSGAGAVVDAGLAGEPDVVITATLSKSIGAAGGVVAGPSTFIDHLVNTGRTFVYDTALPPAVAAGALQSVEILRASNELRALVKSRATHAVAVLRAAAFDLSEPAAGIVSVTAPDAASALAWSLACRSRGVAVGCFRPPSTPDNRSRLRLTINAGISASDFDKALAVIVETAP